MQTARRSGHPPKAGNKGSKKPPRLFKQKEKDEGNLLFGMLGGLANHIVDMLCSLLKEHHPPLLVFIAEPMMACSDSMNSFSIDLNLYIVAQSQIIN